LVIGPRTDCSEADLRHAIEVGSVDQRLFQHVECRAGQVMLVPAGTLHSIGPGAFVYEIQQPSDLTFRVFDWDRPETSDRPLHRAEALASIDASGLARPAGDVASLESRPLVTDFFGLEAVALPAAVVRHPAGALEVLTVIRGTVAVSGPGFAERLGPLETLVVPASMPLYELSSTDQGLVLVGSA
jgi:mannose-6-phosphate isomerase